MTIDTTTGEIATVDTSSEIAVTSYLQHARDWLATAVESTGPEQIAAAKAEIATAAEATKQLGLSKDIREDAAEMVRRAEYALGKSIRKGQAEGTVATELERQRAGGQVRQVGKADADLAAKPGPRDFAKHGELNAPGGGIYAMANASVDEFESALTEARAEGNLSRTNVVRKLTPNRARPAPAAEQTLNLIESLADKAARETQKLTTDQIRRVKPNAAEWIDGIRKSVETLQGLLVALEQKD